MKAIVALALLALFHPGGAVCADSEYPDRPLNVRVTGTLLPYEWPGREDLVTVGIYVDGQPWLLRLGKVEGLTVFERERAVGEDVLLRWVRFYGAKEHTGKLRDPASEGKAFVIEGRLDTTQRRFLVTGVKEAETGRLEDPNGQ